jgi:hypothetical protein
MVLLLEELEREVLQAINAFICLTRRSRTASGSAEDMVLSNSLFYNLRDVYV